MRATVYGDDEGPRYFLRTSPQRIAAATTAKTIATSTTTVANKRARFTVTKSNSPNKRAKAGVAAAAESKVDPTRPRTWPVAESYAKLRALIEAAHAKGDEPMQDIEVTVVAGGVPEKLWRALDAEALGFFRRGQLYNPADGSVKITELPNPGHRHEGATGYFGGYVFTGAESKASNRNLGTRWFGEGQHRQWQSRS